LTQSELISDTAGAIAALAIRLQGCLLTAGEQGAKAAYEALVCSLHGDTCLTALTDDEPTVAAWLKDLNPDCSTRILSVPQGSLMDSKAWMRDAFLTATLDGKKTYLRPTISKGGGEEADWLAAADGTPVVDMPYIALDGGDCIVGPGYRLIGARAVDNTSKIVRYGFNQRLAMAELTRLDSRQLFQVGYRLKDVRNKALWFIERFQLDHLSLSADVGEHWLEVLQGSDPCAAAAAIVEMDQNKLYQDWAHIDLVVASTGRKRDEKDLLLVASVILSANPTMSEIIQADCLDALAIYLRDECGFAIIRTVSPYIPMPGGPLWYNNVLVQSEPPIVWLPAFGSDPRYRQFDASNQAIWEMLGFEVRPVSGWLAFAPDSGSIRCATNVTERRGHTRT